MRAFALAALLYLLAGLLIGLWLGPILLMSGRLELAAIAWAALPAWLLVGLFSYIAWADKAGRNHQAVSAALNRGNNQ
ncbi:hypothetical protein H3221_016570 [Pseudomonas sp. LMG 31766]|jgi:hypothetical protein|uniref:Uncharacterized protein n=1 Tax=Pseudomonas chaetocerotis TaxID=2758695 RepID=A0A931D4E5_9PSED|nr:hypothetical protein [Pseudomonas chaetocerotis]MBZ9666359.1 hypothetical protein [Pseudomonas chaetocerotis]